MTESNVRRLWRLFDERDFDAVGELLHDDFVALWPQSRERIRGRDNFIAVNKNYPGVWKVTVHRVMSAPDVVVSEVSLSDGTTTVYAVSFFEFRDGKIVALTEYWGDTYPAPAWRTAWIEKF